jgi:hypothetical protein
VCYIIYVCYICTFYEYWNTITCQRQLICLHDLMLFLKQSCSIVESADSIFAHGIDPNHGSKGRQFESSLLEASNMWSSFAWVELENEPQWLRAPKKPLDAVLSQVGYSQQRIIPPISLSLYYITLYNNDWFCLSQIQGEILLHFLYPMDPNTVWEGT